MKTRWIGLAMVLMLIADAFLKVYVERSTSFASFFQPLFLTCTVLLVACCLYLFFSMRKSTEATLWEANFAESRIGRATMILAAIVLFGALVRFWRLDTLFMGFFLDEAYNGLDVIA